jgi:hypothetical protein
VTDETPLFFLYACCTADGAKGSKSVHVNMSWLQFWLVEGNTPFVVLKGKHLRKVKLHIGIIFKCIEDGWITEELVVK